MSYRSTDPGDLGNFIDSLFRICKTYESKGTPEHALFLRWREHTDVVGRAERVSAFHDNLDINHKAEHRL